MRHAERYGLENTPPEFSFKNVMTRIHKVIADIAPNDSVERYTELGVEVLKGYAKFIDPWTVEIALNDGVTQTLTARSLLSLLARAHLSQICRVWKKPAT